MALIVRDVRDAIAQLAGDSKAFTGRTAHHELRGRVIALLLVTIALAALATALMTWVGHHDAHTSVVWSTSSLLTGATAPDLGSGTYDWLGLALELWALTAVGALAGSFGAFFLRVHLERGDTQGGAREGQSLDAGLAQKQGERDAGDGDAPRKD